MPRIKIQIGDFRINQEERKAIEEVLNSGRVSEGKKVREFEEEFAKFVGTKQAVVFNSGTSALIAGLTALQYHQDFRITPSKKVVTTPITYIATINAIIRSGLNPVYVDVDRETFVITPESIKSHLEKAENILDYSLIMPVHLMGFPCDMDEINKIARKYGLQVFEDSAQALGTIYKGKKTGSLSLLAGFSFYIAHNIQVGEMGALSTDDEKIVRLCRKIKANGRMCDCSICTRTIGVCQKMRGNDSEEDLDPRFTHELVGYNFKTTEFQAALGMVQLKRIDWIIERRRENVKYLNESLEKYSDILQLPKYMPNVSYLGYPIVIKTPDKISRKKLRAELEKRGIETRPLFGCIPIHQPAFTFLKEEYEGKLPNAEYIGRNAFYIGCHQYLTTEDLDYIISAFKEIFS